jgi:hypothetical protein
VKRWTVLIFFLVTCFLRGEAHAGCTTVAVITGAFPTSTPAVLTSNSIPMNGKGALVRLHTVGGTATYTLIGWSGGSAGWWGNVGDILTDSSTYGANSDARFDPGCCGGYQNLAIWLKTANGGSSTLGSAQICTDVSF